ncbi:MAG TPA: S41 family peptidase [Gemmatimonadaceae bacterium]|nr:S41 family peptidase [Gemmatimonadaceae bacterium]
MDYIRQLGPIVLDHRFRRLTETLLRSAEEIYEERGLPFRGRWASTYQLLEAEGPIAVGQIADRLKLTHPGVIGITDEMMAAGIVDAIKDPGDARRRMLALTPRGKRISAELSEIWRELGNAQVRRFAAAGCDIMTVLTKVEDDLADRALAREVLDKLAGSRKRAASSSNSRQKSPTLRRVTRTALSILGVTSVVSSYSVTLLSAQTVAAPPTVIDAAVRSALVNALSDSLINGYIYEKTGRMIADTLRSELRSGQYDRITSGDSLARRINSTLRRLSDDRHLGVQYGGSLPEAAAPTTRRVRVPSASGTPSPAPAEGTPRRVRVMAGDDIAAPAGAFSSRAHGIASAQILPGNIGYLDLRGFSTGPDALRAVDSSMARFANAKALIIDLGGNRGGGPQMIQHLSAYLFDKRTHLVSTFARGMDAPMERWTSETVPGKRLPNVPVYILTSRNTISAAESFTFGLRVNGRATIVGERTAGGGHFGGFIPLPAGFTVFLPRGRTYDPRTSKGWEAEGIKPDVEVPYTEARQKALELIQSKR